MSNKEATYQGRTVSIVEVKGGWTTILDGMKQTKVRNSELGAVKEATKVPGKISKQAIATVTGQKPPKAPKEAKAPKAPRTQSELDARLIKADLTRYTVSDDVKTASGRKAIDNDDDFARELRGEDLASVYRIASQATGQTQKGLHEKYDHLNPGMQRMNLGNLIRGVRRAAIRAAAKEEATAAKAAKAKPAK
jgi:hypothetical protein